MGRKRGRGGVESREREEVGRKRRGESEICKSGERGSGGLAVRKKGVKESPHLDSFISSFPLN